MGFRLEGVARGGGIELGVGAEVVERDEAMINLKGIFDGLAIVDALEDVAVREPIDHGHSADGANKDEITRGKNFLEVVGPEDIKIERTVSFEGLTDSVEIVIDKLGFGAGGEEHGEFTGEFLARARGRADSARAGRSIRAVITGEVAIEVLGARESGFDGIVFDFAEVGGGGSGAVGGGGGDGINFGVVGTFEEGGLGVGWALEDEVVFTTTDSESALTEVFGDAFEPGGEFRIG